MIDLFDAATSERIGSIGEDELQFLIDQLEEESPEDQDYYINRAEIESFSAAGAPDRLLAILLGALGDREDMDIRWDKAQGRTDG